MISAAGKMEIRRRRMEGETLQAIGSDFGVTRERIRQITADLSPPAVRAAACLHCGERLPGRALKWCGERCRKDAWNERHRAECSDCGKTLSTSKGVRCVDCFNKHHKSRRHQMFDRLSELWEDGYSLKEIAEITDTTPGTVSVRMARAKHEGWTFTFRRPGWRGHTAKPGPPLKEIRTHRDAQNRMVNAVRAGQLKRPDHCERCGVDCHPDGHHHDYSKPLDVEWLCRSCHMAHHSAERKAVA